MGNQVTTPLDGRVQDLTSRSFFGPAIKEGYRLAADGETPTVDLLGFPLEKGSADGTQDFDEQAQAKDGKKREERAEKEKERVAKWEEMCNYCREYKIKLQEHPKYHSRVIKGMPAIVRGYIWTQLLDIETIKKSYEQVGIQERTFDRKMKSYYQCLIQHGSDNPNEYNGPRGYIDRDLGRTFPRHPLYAGGTPESSPAIQSLKNVLVAYSAHHHEIGYTQGMNYIVAMLLGFMPEEDAFWAFVAIMGKRENHPSAATASPSRGRRRSGSGSLGGNDGSGSGKDTEGFEEPDYNFEDVMKKGLPLAQQHFWCLDRLLERRLPRLYAQLAECDVRAEMYSLGWILTLFIRDSPLTFAVRVWDVFLSYGWSTFFSVALAVLYKARRELMQCKTFERAMLTLKSIVSIFKREKILKYAFEPEKGLNVTPEELKKLAAEYLESPEYKQRLKAMARQEESRKRYAREDAELAAKKAAAAAAAQRTPSSMPTDASKQAAAAPAAAPASSSGSRRESKTTAAEGSRTAEEKRSVAAANSLVSRAVVSASAAQDSDEEDTIVRRKSPGRRTTRQQRGK